MKKPNIVMIFTDQQHKYALGRTDPAFKTPCLDKLCDEGVIFDRAYSSNPICGPYRGCLLSGKYTSHSKVYYNGNALPESEVSLAEALSKGGYNTCFVGKWHLGSNRDGVIPKAHQGGFEHFTAYQCHNGFDPNPPHNNRVCFWDGEGNERAYNVHRTEATTEAALEKLDLLSKDPRPFFCLIGYQAPHYPLQPLPEYRGLYDGVIFEKKPDYEYVEPYTPTFNPPSIKPFTSCPDYQNYGGDMDEYMRMYAGMVSQIDASVGRITDKLKALGVYSDTVIIYTSDHGDMQGSHGLKNKCVTYEKSCGVPLIVKFPHSEGGVRSRHHLSTVDITATILDVASSGEYMECDGKSFYPCINKGDEKPSGVAVSEHLSRNPEIRSWRMICCEDIKLTVDYDTLDPISLYDISSDPYEMKDLKNSSRYARTVEQLTARLKETLDLR